MTEINNDLHPLNTLILFLHVIEYNAIRFFLLTKMYVVDPVKPFYARQIHTFVDQFIIMIYSWKLTSPESSWETVSLFLVQISLVFKVSHWNITNRFKSCGVMVSMWYIVVEATCLPSDCWTTTVYKKSLYRNVTCSCYDKLNKCSICVKQCSFTHTDLNWIKLKKICYTYLREATY